MCFLLLLLRLHFPHFKLSILGFLLLLLLFFTSSYAFLGFLLLLLFFTSSNLYLGFLLFLRLQFLHFMLSVFRLCFPPSSSLSSSQTICYLAIFSSFVISFTSSYPFLGFLFLLLLLIFFTSSYLYRGFLLLHLPFPHISFTFIFFI